MKARKVTMGLAAALVFLFLCGSSVSAQQGGATTVPPTPQSQATSGPESAGAKVQPAPSVVPEQSGPASAPGQDPKLGKNRIFGVIPNYRTIEEARTITPLSTGQKFKLAAEDSFDPFAYPIAGLFAGISFEQKQYKSFGQGAQGVAKYYGVALANQTIGNMMTEAVFPTMLRQDPRYLLMAKGGFFKRTRYAVSRLVVTRTDAGGEQFNLSELGGNAVAAGITNLYIPAQDRSLSNTIGNWALQISLDGSFNVLKEFWPDIRHKIFGR